MTFKYTQGHRRWYEMVKHNSDTMQSFTLITFIVFEKIATLSDCNAGQSASLPITQSHIFSSESINVSYYVRTQAVGLPSNMQQLPNVFELKESSSKCPSLSTLHTSLTSSSSQLAKWFLFEVPSPTQCRMCHARQCKKM